MITLVVTFVVSPSDAGVYAAGTVAFLFFQSLGEQTLRQLGVEIWTTTSGRSFLSRITIFLAVASAIE